MGGASCPALLEERITRSVMAGLVIALAGSVIVTLSTSCQVQAYQLICTGMAEICTVPPSSGMRWLFWALFSLPVT